MRKIDDTKESIGVTNLNEGERKKLFKDLTDAGGKVVSDPHTKPKAARQGPIDREKQKEYKERIEERRRNMKPESAKKSASRASSSSAPALDFFSRLKLNFRLRFLKICQSGYFLFHDEFIKDLYGNYRTAILEAKVQYYVIFKKNMAESKRILAQLNSQNPILFKLMEIIGEIGDIPETISEKVDVSELQQSLTETFKTLSLLQPYENTLLNAYLKSIDLCRNVDNNKKYPNQQAQKRMIKESLYIIFNKFYPKLHWLVCYYNKCYISLGDIKAVEKLLGIDPVEKPENAPIVEKITNTQKPENQSETAAEETDQSQKDMPRVLPDEIKKGLEIMSEYDYDRLRKEFDPKGNFDSIKNNDKALITFLIFNKFIKEFSFILNTNKINFFSNVKAVDYQSKLKDLYYEIDKPRENLRSYAASSITYNQVRREKPLSSSQYIAYTKRLQETTVKCETDGKNVRMHIKKYMEKLADGMKVLLDDMDGAQEIIQNPQEVLTMDDPIEGKRKLDGKKVFEAINLCYCFASAFTYRLDTGGDLSGDLEFSDEELAVTKNKNDAGLKNDTASENNAAKKTDNSILDELDSFEGEMPSDLK